MAFQHKKGSRGLVRKVYKWGGAGARGKAGCCGREVAKGYSGKFSSGFGLSE